MCVCVCVCVCVCTLCSADHVLERIRAVLEIILGGAQTLFCPAGGGCFLDNVSEGWGMKGSLVLGVKAYLIHSGAG